MSSVLNNAITGVASNFTVDYANALLSKGILSGASNPTTDLAVSGQVTFGWDDNSTDNNANATDKAMLLVYNPAKKESAYILDGAIRTAGTQVVNVPSSYTGSTIELFMAFVSADGINIK